MSGYEIDLRHWDGLDYVGLVFRLAQRYRGTAELEDLMQEGLIALEKAKAKYDPSRGAPFPVYATYVIRSRMNDLWDKKRRRPEDRVEEVEEDRLVSHPRESMVDDRDELLRRLERLSDRERQVIFALYWQDRPSREVADLLNVDRFRISKIHRRALRKLAAA